MGMNKVKTGSNMYQGWLTHTYNPIKGKCFHDCTYCLTGDTKVLMSDYNEKRISEIKIGEKIVGLLREENRFYKFSNEVVIKNLSQRLAKTIIITTSDSRLQCTKEHPLMGSTEKRGCSDWRQAGGFSPYEHIRYIGQPSTINGLSVRGSKHSQIYDIQQGGEKTVYNLETSSGNFIANGFIVHNCYMKRFPLPELHLDEKELKTDLGSGNFIFVGSSCDMWAQDVPYEWICKVLLHCKEYPNNKYLFQSKHPFRFIGTSFPQNTILGTTIETNRDYKISYAPLVMRRAECMQVFMVNKIVTCEPLLDFDLEPMIELIKIARPNWVNIGADSRSCGLPEPSKDKVLALINELKKFTSVKLKKNLDRIIKCPCDNKVDRKEV